MAEFSFLFFLFVFPNESGISGSNADRLMLSMLNAIPDSAAHQSRHLNLTYIYDLGLV